MIVMTTVSLSASHSHLFRGARLSGFRPEISLPLRATTVRISFSDGVELEAELLEGSAPGSLALAVPAYPTATGHPVAAALWPVTEISADQADGRLTIKLGQRIQ
jgi:hypothetical protein